VRESFGPYLLVDRIATGGMGEIFLAKLMREQGFEKMVVIKRMLPHLSRNPAFIQMFLTEAKIAAQLSHQNIVHTFDFGKIEDSYYIAMEFVQGVDLRTLLVRAEERGERLPLGQVFQVASAVCAALDYAHRRCDALGEPLGIIHRDVSPQNILVSFEGEVKLTDFGLAKAKLQAVESESGSLKGKYSYLSPEQVAGRKVDQRSDLFSLGVVLYETWYGERLFPLGDNLIATLEQIRSCELPDLRERLPKLPESAISLLERALSRDPEGRFESAAAMLEAVEQIRAELGDVSGSVALASSLRRLFPERNVLPEVGRTDETIVAPKPIVLRAGRPPSGTATLPPPRSARRGRALFALAMVVLAGGAAATYAALGADPVGSAPAGPVPAGRLEVRSVPSGASIFVDGKDSGRTTPALFDGLDPVRALAVELRLAGYEPVRWTGRAAGERIDARLERLSPRLELRSRPDGADIFLDGVRVAHQTPTVLEGLSPGTHRVRLSKIGFRAWERTLEVEAREQSVVTGELQPAARLRVATSPRGAQVLVNGAVAASDTPAVLEGLEPGATLRIEARKRGFRAAARRVRLEGAEGEVQLALRPLGITFAVSSGAGTPRVLFDKQVLGRTPVPALRIEPGAHLVRLVDDEHQRELKVLVKVAKPGERPSPGDVVLNLDAVPWAEVHIDGRPSGRVPLANRPVGFGTHRIELLRGAGEKELYRFRVEPEPER
jgi:serine/threonine protein kinase